MSTNDGAAEPSERSSLLGTGRKQSSENTTVAPSNELPKDSTLYALQKSFIALLLLTVPLGGPQVAWSIQQSSLFPHLLNLPSLNASLIAIVYLAGPVTGIFVQPVVGYFSSSTRSSSGGQQQAINLRRTKTLLISGALLVALSLVLLAFSPNTLNRLFHYSPAQPPPPQSSLHGILEAGLSGLGVWTLDIGLNIIEITSRILIVTCTPHAQQTQVAALAARTIGTVKVLGFGLAALPFHASDSGWNLDRFQSLTICAAVAAIIASIAAVFAKRPAEAQDKEDVGTERGRSGERTGGRAPKNEENGSWWQQLKDMVSRLSPLTKAVCVVQWWAWMGWFAFTFYGSTYVALLYIRPRLENSNLSNSQIDAIHAEGTRLGSVAMLTLAVSTLICSILLPLIVIPVEEDSATDSTLPRGKTNTFSAKIQQWSRKLQVIELARAWQLSHLLTTACYLSTFFITRASSGIILGGVLGVSWALTSWAPFAILGVEIQRLETLQTNAVSDDDDDNDQAAAKPKYEARTGVILGGFHNFSMSAPQIVATLCAGALFKVFAGPDGKGGENKGLPWVMHASAIVTLVALWYSRNVLRILGALAGRL